MERKTFFIVPGFKMSPKHKVFLWLVRFLESKGFKVVGMPIAWNYHTLSENAEEFVEFYNKNKSKKNYVLGFSYGAVITLMTANILRPEKIYLCSLSSDFKEDIMPMKPWIQKYIGKRRIADAKARSGRKLAKDLVVPSVIFCGEKEAREYPPLKKRCEETAKLAKHSKLVIVPNAPHDISYPAYMEAIKKELK